jgi:MerR family transcriptional regulator, mercuric resistance operon regulatory protein
VTSLTIRGLADAAAVHVETVRYYQRRKLLREPPKPPGGIRRYEPADVERLRFIRRAQSMGFALREIAELLSLHGRQACDQTRRATELKLEDVRRKLTELRRLEAELVELVAVCSRQKRGADCPALHKLKRG